MVVMAIGCSVPLIAQEDEGSSKDSLLAKNVEYWFPGPGAIQYLITPSAIGLRKGEVYFHNAELSINSINVALTDHFSLSGGFDITSIFEGLESGEVNPWFYISPKVTGKINEYIHVGGGLLFLRIPPTEGQNFLDAYVLTTIGSPTHNVTAGAGMGFIGSAFETKPVLTLSGMTTISGKFGLLTENWFVPMKEYYPVFSYAIRYFGKDVAADLGFLNNKDFSSVFIPGVPYIAVIIKFKE